MLVATQIVPLINLVSIATVLLVVLVTRLHLHFVSLGIGMLWRLAVSSVISLAPILMLAHLEVRFFERTRPVFFAFFLVFLAVCWLIPILGSRKSIRRWLIAKQNHSWAIATAFIAFFGAYFSCWAYCLPDDGLVSMVYSFRESRGLLLLLLPMLIAERSIYVPRLAVSRVGKTVASVTVIGLIGLVVKDYRFIAEWKSNHLLPPQLWREFGVVQNLRWWVIVGSAMMLPSRFIVR